MPIHDSAQMVLVPQDAPRQGLDDPNRLPRVRKKLAAILADVEHAQTMPWNDAQRGTCEILIRQMTGWLPPDEASDIRHRFAAALARLDQDATGIARS